jgi:hypothetical protein
VRCQLFAEDKHSLQSDRVEAGLQVASWEVAKLTKKKRRVILVAVALEWLGSNQSESRTYSQTSSKEHNKDSNLFLPMQRQCLQLREWNHEYKDIQRRVDR